MFIPIGDDNSRRRQPPVVVWVLLGLNLVVWVAQLLGGLAFTYGYSAVPFEITHGVDLVESQWIQLQGSQVELPHYPGPSPIQFTLLSSMFMHGGWMHLIGNMIYLMIFGDQIEDLLGRGRFVAFYLACGFAASCAHIFVGPESIVPSLGASGAIAGVLGAYLVKYPRNPVYVLVLIRAVRLPAYLVLGGWFVIQLLGQMGPQGPAGGVAYMAHLGGFVTGIALIMILTGKGRALPPRRPVPVYPAPPSNAWRPPQ